MEADPTQINRQIHNLSLRPGFGCFCSARLQNSKPVHLGWEQGSDTSHFTRESFKASHFQHGLKRRAAFGTANPKAIKCLNGSLVRNTKMFHSNKETLATWQTHQSHILRNTKIWICPKIREPLNWHDVHVGFQKRHAHASILQPRLILGGDCPALLAHRHDHERRPMLQTLLRYAARCGAQRLPPGSSWVCALGFGQTDRVSLRASLLVIWRRRDKPKNK